MNTKELLTLINEHLDKNIPSTTDNVMQVLHKYTLRKLRATLCNITDNGKYQASSLYDHTLLRDFLKEFYAIVKDTDALPLHAPHSDLTVIMLNLAEILKNYFYKTNIFRLLMPSIRKTYYEISSTTLDDRNLKLHDFVLGDDHKSLIEVLNCLKYACEDGELKHTWFDHHTIHALSNSEKRRVINHSKATQTYWLAIQDKVQVTLKGASFGAALNRLSEDLGHGGEFGNRDGDEFNAGRDANVGIVNFFAWYDKLLLSEQEYLNNQKSNSCNLKQLLDRLRRPADKDFTQEIFCVENIAVEICKILQYNTTLYNNYPANARKEALTIEQVNRAVINTDRELTKAFNEPNYTVTASYGGTGRQLLLQKLLQLKDLSEYVSNRTIENMRRQPFANDSNAVIRKHNTSRGTKKKRPRLTN